MPASLLAGGALLMQRLIYLSGTYYGYQMVVAHAFYRAASADLLRMANS